MRLGDRHENLTSLMLLLHNTHIDNDVNEYILTYYTTSIMIYRHIIYSCVILYSSGAVSLEYKTLNIR